MDRSEAELPEAIAKMHRDAKRHVLGARSVDSMKPRFWQVSPAIRSLESAPCHLSAWRCGPRWWFRPEHGRSLEAVAEEIADNAAAVVQRAAPAKQIATVAELTAKFVRTWR